MNFSKYQELANYVFLILQNLYVLNDLMKNNNKVEEEKQLPLKNGVPVLISMPLD